jgi:pimeloyl-ACP methyl ester carboxylesterase
MSRKDKKPSTVPAEIQRTRRLYGTLSVVAPPIAGWLGYRTFRTPRTRSLPDGTPFDEAQHQSVDFMGESLQVYMWGDNNAPTVLIAHGWEDSAQRMKPYIQPLRDAGYRVVAYDALAHGHSGGRYNDAHYFGEGLAAVAASLAPIHGMIGHSLGGSATAVGWWLHRETFPELNAVAMISAPDRLVDVVRNFGTGVGMSERAYANMEARFVRRIGAPLEDFHVSRLVADAPFAGLIVHDTKDVVVPSSAAESIHGAWQHGNAELMLTTGLGHRRVVKANDVVTRVMDFITTQLG